MHFVPIHVYIIESKFGGKILTFTYSEVMSCTTLNFVASATDYKIINIVQFITSVNMRIFCSSSAHRRQNQEAPAPTKFISAHRNLVCLVS